MLLYFMAKVLFGAPFWLLKRPKVVGRENLPENGGAVIAANHIRWLNGALLAVIIPRHVAFGARADFFRMKALNRPVCWVLRAFGQLPVERHGRKAAEFVEAAAMQAANGRLVGIFPEGGISPDGRLYDAYHGVARIALKAEVPIIPIGLVYPRWRWCRVRVVVGTPITVAGARTHQRAKPLAEEVTAALARLTGQPRAHCRLKYKSSML